MKKIYYFIFLLLITLVVILLYSDEPFHTLSDSNVELKHTNSESINTFEKVSNWQKSWTIQSKEGTSMKLNSDDSRSKMTLSTDGTKPVFIRNSNLQLDLSEFTGISLSVNIPKPKDVSKITIYLANDTKMVNYAASSFGMNSSLEGENVFRAGKSNFSTFNNFDWNSLISAIQIRFETLNKKPSTITLNQVDGINFNNGTLVFTMDDAWKSQYDVAYQMMKKYSFPGTIAVITNALGGTKMTVDELREVQDNGWAVINHTHTHKKLSEITLEEQISEIETARKWLDYNGFSEGSRFLVYPYGSYTQETIDFLQKNKYYAARTVVDEVEGRYLPRPYELKTINLTYNRDISQIKRAVDTAIETGGTVFLLNHKFDDDMTSMSFSPSKFEDVLEYIYEKQRKQEIDVMNIITWYETYISPIN